MDTCREKNAVLKKLCEIKKYIYVCEHKTTTMAKLGNKLQIFTYKNGWNWKHYDHENILLSVSHYYLTSTPVHGKDGIVVDNASQPTIFVLMTV